MMTFPIYGENKKWQPNHQPDIGETQKSHCITTKNIYPHYLSVHLEVQRSEPGANPASPSPQDLGVGIPCDSPLYP